MSLAFEFTAYETLTFINPESILPYQIDNPEYVAFTQPETYVESDDPAIMALAASFSNEEDNPYMLARKFYDYIVDNVKYKNAASGSQRGQILA